MQHLSFYITSLLNGEEPFILVAVALQKNPKAKAKFFDISQGFEKQLKSGKIDTSKLTLNMTCLLKELIDDANDEAQGKLQMIEEELNEIAEEVKENINQLFARGEKMSSLEAKSMGIKHVARTLKSRS